MSDQEQAEGGVQQAEGGVQQTDELTTFVGQEEVVHDEEKKEEIGEEIEGEESEYNDGEMGPEEHRSDEKVTGEEVTGEEVGGEHVEGEEKESEKKEEKQAVEEERVEEEQFVEEPPPDPAAPLNLSDSKEDIKPKFELRPDQLAEVEKLWELYQDYTPSYTDIKDYVTEKEMVYLLKCLLLMTYTEEQFQELLVFCVRPPDPNGHITYEQFLKMVTIRQRDLPIEEEIRSALQVLDPGRTGQIDREYLREVLKKMGNKMPEKVLDVFIKEVDMSNDGSIGIDDVVGTMCIDLNRDDIIMLMQAIYPSDEQPANEDD